MAIEAFAPAKINLALHVTGRRNDGYHLLDSLVVFLDAGDRVRATAAGALSLDLSGPQAAGVPQGADNLVLRAARLLSPDRGAALVLEKHLPPASGIGGGSSDAAAALRALSALWSCPLPDAASLLRLGADVPACVMARPLRMRGIGEVLTPLPAPLPDLALVLVNPRIETPTPAVFAALAQRDNPPLPDPLPPLGDVQALAAFLRAARNDLEPPARALCPPVGAVLAALAAQPEVMLARMSGSGATCFGLCASRALAESAARALARARPDWWVMAASPWDGESCARSTPQAAG